MVPDALQLQLLDEQRRAIVGYEVEAQTALANAAHLHVTEVRDCALAVEGFKDVTVARTAFGPALQHRKYQKDALGRRITGTETNWQLAQAVVLNARTVVDAEQFFVVTADDDGCNRTRRSLKNVTSNLKRSFPSIGLVAPRTSVARVAVAHRLAFVPVPSDQTRWAVDVRHVCYGYGADAPKHMLLLSDTTNTSLAFETPGAAHGFTPMYTTLRCCGDDGGGGSKLRNFATDVTVPMPHDQQQQQPERGSQVRTGPSSLTPTSSCVWHVAIPLLHSGAQEAVAAAAPAAVSDNDDDSPEAAAPRRVCWRASRANPPPVCAREARTGIGSFIEDAEQTSITSPVADGTPAIATAMYIMTVEAGVIAPDKQSVLDASRFLKKRARQSNENPEK